MPFPKQCIIIGGGKSIKTADLAVLGASLQGKLVIAINYAFKYFPHTFLTFSDREFYYPKVNEDELITNPNIYEELKKEPLIIGINENGIEEFKLPNTILFHPTKFYKGNLTGVFAISLACHLLNDCGEIYLLGYDWTRQPIPNDKSKYNPRAGGEIHFYNDLNHRGTGHTGYYDRHNADKPFEPFLNKKDVKIFNVSLESNIHCFEKTSYPTFYNLLDLETYNQEELRSTIIYKLS